MTQETKDLFAHKGSLYSLSDNNTWFKIGLGEITLTYNPHNPNRLILKLIPDLSSNDEITIFQIKPKLKSKGPHSWVLKGTNTKINRDKILAVRFQKEDQSEEFKELVLDAGKATVNDNHIPKFKKYMSISNMSPDETLSLLPKTIWECRLCTNKNKPQTKKCSICNTPRPLKLDLKKQDSSNSLSDNVSISDTIEDLPQPNSPRKNGKRERTETLDIPNKNKSVYGNIVLTPKDSRSTFDWSTVDTVKCSLDIFFNRTQTQCGLKDTPSDNDRIKSTKEDFRRLLAFIDSNLRDQTLGIKLFDDLRKIAKRLLRNDKKYRCFDLKNPIVQQRLLHIEGVLAYLKFLGFSNESNKTKLICPENTPAKSIIKDAMVICEEFLNRSKEQKTTLDQLRSNSAKFTLEIQKQIKKRRQKNKKKKIKKNGRLHTRRLSRQLQHPIQIPDRVTVKSLDKTKNNTMKKDEKKEENKNNETSESKENCNNENNKNSLEEPKYKKKRTISVAPLEDINEENESDSKQEKTQREKDDYTIHQLIWQITSPSSLDDKTDKILLLCHGSFTTTKILFNTLKERYDSLTDNDDNTLTENDIWLIKRKVGELLKYWVVTFYEEDFEFQPDVLDLLEGMLDDMEEDSDFRVKKLANKIGNELDKAEELYKRKEFKKTHQPKKNILSLIGNDNTKFKFLNKDPKVFAEQITLMDYKIFKNIEKRECLGQAWKKKNREDLAPNLLAMISQFNSITKWFQILILTCKSLRDRAKCLKKCIKIMSLLLDYRNFSSACAIKTALNSTPIYRLKDCWNKLETKHKNNFDRISKIFTFNNTNYRELRKLQSEAHAPSVLYIGLTLQDIVSIDEGNVDRKDGIINFNKLMRLHERIESIAMYQKGSYKIKDNTVIQECIKKQCQQQQNMDDETLYQLSTKVKEQDAKS